MAIINTNSYVQLALGLNDPSAIKLANTLSQKIDLMKDAHFEVANEGLSHIGERVLALPQGSVAGFNQFIPATTADTAYVREGIMQLRDYSRYDVNLLRKLGLKERQKHDQLHIVSLIQFMAEKLTYGNKANGFDEVDGLITRYNIPGACDGIYQVDGVAQLGLPTGAGYSSMVLVDWGPEKAYITYPGDTTLGVMTEDKGNVLMQNTSNGIITMNSEYVTELRAEFGLFIHDPRSVARIASIAIGGGYVSASFQAIERQIMQTVEVAGMENPVLYCGRTLKSWFRMRANEKSNVFYTDTKNPWAQPILAFGDIPIRLNDRMLDTEARLQ